MTGDRRTRGDRRKTRTRLERRDESARARHRRPGGAAPGDGGLVPAGAQGTAGRASPRARRPSAGRPRLAEPERGGAVVRGDKARWLNEPLDSPGDKHPAGEAPGDAPQPRDREGDLVALVALCFVSHVRDSALGTRSLRLCGQTEFPLAGILCTRGKRGRNPPRPPRLSHQSSAS